jgi:hypothetical protein
MKIQYISEPRNIEMLNRTTDSAIHGSGIKGPF